VQDNGHKPVRGLDLLQYCDRALAFLDIAAHGVEMKHDPM
jgi:hypothetical protein